MKAPIIYLDMVRAARLPTRAELERRVAAYHPGIESALWDARHPMHMTARIARDSAFALADGRYSDGPEAA